MRRCGGSPEKNLVINLDVDANEGSFTVVHGRANRRANRDVLPRKRLDQILEYGQSVASPPARLEDVSCVEGGHVIRFHRIEHNRLWKGFQLKPSL